MADGDSFRAAAPNGVVAADKQGDDGWLDRVRSVLGMRPVEGLRESLSQALAVDEGEDSIFSPEERRLLQNILLLRGLRIADVMVPRADVRAVEESVSLSELLRTFEEAGHSRLPVFHGTLDNPVGFVHAKDVMIRLARDAAADDGLNFGAVDFSKKLSDLNIIRQVPFVPPSMPAMDLMVRMRATRAQLALVVDEYGGTDGLVSLEDLVETIIGDIQDEYDLITEPTLTEGEPGTWLADARVELKDFSEATGIAMPEVEILEEIDTLGGIVFALVGRVPVRGELISSGQLPGFEFEVLDADPRKLKRLKVRLKPMHETNGAIGQGAAAV
ncbi:MAG: hemolysin family protein [Pseudomonadota bacterium]